MQVQDTVTQVIARKTPKAMAYTVRLAKEGYIGVGFEAPACVEGDTVSMQYELNNAGYKQMVKGSLQVLSSGAPTPAPQSSPAPAGAQGGTSKTSYWDDKEKRDVSIQKAIQYQASRNIAVEVAKIALEQDCLSLGAKKAARVDILMAFIDEVTDRYNKDVTDFVQNGERSGEYQGTRQDNEAQEAGDFE